jgi:hypothetical protein
MLSQWLEERIHTLLFNLAVLGEDRDSEETG